MFIQYTETLQILFSVPCHLYGLFLCSNYNVLTTNLFNLLHLVFPKPPIESHSLLPSLLSIHLLHLHSGTIFSLLKSIVIMSLPCWTFYRFHFLQVQTTYIQIYLQSLNYLFRLIYPFTVTPTYKSHSQSAHSLYGLQLLSVTSHNFVKEGNFSLYVFTHTPYTQNVSSSHTVITLSTNVITTYPDYTMWNLFTPQLCPPRR